MKHHCGKLLENKISQISLGQMYDYKNSSKLYITDIKINCINHWNSLSMNIKSIPYISAYDAYKHLKKLN